MGRNSSLEPDRQAASWNQARSAEQPEAATAAPEIRDAAVASAGMRQYGGAIVVRQVVLHQIDSGSVSCVPVMAADSGG